jgi:hypothetical protein
MWIVFDQDYENSIFYTPGDTLKLETGTHPIILVHPNYRDIRTRVNIVHDQLIERRIIFLRGERFDSSLSSYKRITEGLEYNISILTDHSSLIVINDSTYGQGSVIADIGPHLHNIRIENAGARNKSESVYINPSGQVDLSIFVLPRRSTALMYSVLPGGSQIYKNQMIKGLAFALAIPAAAIYADNKYRSFHEINNDYERMIIRYNSMTDEREVLEFGNLVEEKYSSVKRAARARDYAIAAAAGLYLYNLVDAIFSTPRSGYRVKVEPADFNARNGYGAGLKMSVNF